MADKYYFYTDDFNVDTYASDSKLWISQTNTWVDIFSDTHYNEQGRTVDVNSSGLVICTDVTALQVSPWTQTAKIKVSTDWGVTFNETTITTNTGGYDLLASGEIDSDGNIWVVAIHTTYEDMEPLTVEVYKSINNGISFSLTASHSGTDYYPLTYGGWIDDFSMCVAKDGLDTNVWVSFTIDWDTFFILKFVNGITYSLQTYAPGENGGTDFPQIAAIGSNWILGTASFIPGALEYYPYLRIVRNGVLVYNANDIQTTAGNFSHSRIKAYGNNIVYVSGGWTSRAKSLVGGKPWLALSKDAGVTWGIYTGPVAIESDTNHWMVAVDITATKIGFAYYTGTSSRAKYFHVYEGTIPKKHFPTGATIDWQTITERAFPYIYHEWLMPVDLSMVAASSYPPADPIDDNPDELPDPGGDPQDIVFRWETFKAIRSGKELKGL